MEPTDPQQPQKTESIPRSVDDEACAQKFPEFGWPLYPFADQKVQLEIAKKKVRKESKLRGWKQTEDELEDGARREMSFGLLLSEMPEIYRIADVVRSCLGNQTWFATEPADWTEVGTFLIQRCGVDPKELPLMTVRNVFWQLQASTKPPTGSKPEQRSWTQVDLDNAIRQYKAIRAASYADLLKAVKDGKKGALIQARKIYGRNAIAKELGVKSKMMVSKSPAWLTIAEELDLPLNRSRRTQGTRHTQRPSRSGYEIAVEEKSATPERGADNAPVEQKLETAERQETIRQINKMARTGKTAKEKADNQKAAEVLIQKLQRDEYTDDQARKVVEMALNQNE